MLNFRINLLWTGRIRNVQNVAQNLHQLGHPKLPNLKLCTKLLQRMVSIGKLNRIIHLHDSALEIRSVWKLIIWIKIYGGSVYKRFYLQSLQVLRTLTLWVHWPFFQVPSWLWFFLRAQFLKVFFFVFFCYFLLIEMSHVFSELFFIFFMYQMERKGLSPCYLFYKSGVLRQFFQKK